MGQNGSVDCILTYSWGKGLRTKRPDNQSTLALSRLAAHRSELRGETQVFLRLTREGLPGQTDQPPSLFSKGLLSTDPNTPTSTYVCFSCRDTFLARPQRPLELLSLKKREPSAGRPRLMAPRGLPGVAQYC